MSALLAFAAASPVHAAGPDLRGRGEGTAAARVQEAAVWAVQGQQDQARATLTPLGDAPPAVFVRACLDLDSGALGRVRAISERSGLDRDEVALLRALAARRAAAPDEDWLSSFVAAWREAGPIDVAVGTPLRGQGDRSAHALMLAPVSMADRFWAVAARPHPTLAQASSVRAAANTQARKLLLIALLPASEAGHSAVRDELIGELAAADPDEMTYPLMRALGETPADRPFSPAEVLALQDAVRRPRLGISVTSLYEAYRSDLEALGDHDAIWHAWQAAMSAYPVDAPGSLWLRAKATQDGIAPAADGRLADVVERVGREVASQTSILAHFIGERLLVRAALLRRDPAAVEVASKRFLATSRLYRAGKRRLDYLGDWPLAGLLRDLADHMGRDEMAVFRQLATLPVREPALPAPPGPDSSGR